MKIRLVALLLCLILIITAVVGCNKETTSSKVEVTSTQDDDEIISSEEISSEEIVETESNDDVSSDYSFKYSDTTTEEEPILVPVKKPEKVEPYVPPKTLYVKNFGAKGDGKTDDAEAIAKAVTALRECSPGSKLIFESNKTYYYKNSGLGIDAMFYFEDDKGYTIKGKNTLIKLGGYDNYYVDMNNCSDMVIEGINFDYAEYKGAFMADVESVNATEGSAIVIADRDINLESGETYFKERANGWFGVVASQKSRHHMYITKYEMLDAKKGRVKVYFDLTDSLTASRLANKYVVESGLVLPMPRSGNLIERGFSIHNTDNFTMRNCNVYSYMRHGMSLQRNTGNILFENVKNVVAPYDKDLQYTGWGDFYHVLNSRGANYKWINCENEYNYDDVFNISAGTLSLEQINTERDVVIGLSGNGFSKVYKGDTLVIINTSTGDLIYRGAIKSVVKQGDDSARVRLEKPMKNPTTGEEVLVWIEEAVGKNAQMIGCKMDGTFRARGLITFTDCEFYVRRFWIGLETQTHEGPLSRNILFKNCKFTCEGDGVIEAFSYCPTNKGYGLENIVFDGCTGLKSSHIAKGATDEIIIK